MNKGGFLFRMLAVYALTLVLGAWFTVKIFQDSHTLYGETVTLVERGLPVLASLSALRTAVVAQEPILYEYYATMDGARFRERWQANRQAIEAHGAKVRRDFPGHPRIAVIHEHDARIGALAADLDRIMGERPVDWDKARALLGEISRHALEINANLDSLAEDVHARVEIGGNAARAGVDAIPRTVLFYSGAMFLIAVVAGYFLRVYLTGERERRHLAMFAERNPNPVLNLNRAGEVVYANPGARMTLAVLGDAAAAPAALLPANSPHRLAEQIEAGMDTVKWEYAVLGREYEATIHYLSDFGLFHAYLTDVTARKEAERHMQFLAFHDPLTELPNRRRFTEDIAMAVAGGQEGAVALIGIDRLRHIVDGVGHGVADRLLQAVAQRLRQAITDSADLCPQASVYRFEGAVFGLLLPCLSSGHAPEQFARRIAQALQPPLQVNGQAFFLGASIGASIYPADDGDAVNLISHADRALQQIKKMGGEGFQAYDRALSIQAAERLELENDLHGALERGELFLVYQPQVETKSRRIIGAEALLRWRHPKHGLIPPARFIPIAEESGLIIAIGGWVLETACQQARVWRDADLPAIRMAINLSARQFTMPDLDQAVRRTLERTGLPGELLELEVTESMAMEDVARSIQVLEALKRLGVYISMDDFGTGYSSLSYLRRLPIDKLKVDQSFVRNLENDHGDAMLVRAVVELGRSLGLSVIAEGVETAAQLEFLITTGCEEAQGYLFGRPLDRGDFELLLGAQISASA